MASSFFLLILPSRTLTIHLGSYNGNVGLSLRGSCYNTADAHHLEQAISKSLEGRPAQVWVDCQQLHALSWLGIRTLLQAHTRCHTAGTTLRWCGLASSLLGQLASGGMHTMLDLLPAEGFEGPHFLLPATAAAPQLAW